MKRHFPDLDALRFILALIVFGGHAMLAETINHSVSTDWVKRFVTLCNSGYLAVSFFFVLSGFLISYLMIEEKDESGSLNVRNFYFRRILRIWPVYFVVLIFGFVIYPFVKTQIGYTDQNPYSMLYQILFLGNFDSIRIYKAGLVGVAPMMIGITWSVSIEEQFYLVWPIIFALGKPQQFWIPCALIIIGSCLFRQFTDDWNLYYHTFTVISDIAIGALGAYLTYYSHNFNEFMRRLSKSAIIVIYVLGILMLMYGRDTLPEHFVSRNYRVFTTVFFCFIIVEQNLARNSVFKLKNLRVLSALSKYTYALYMLHPIGIQTSIILFRYLNIQRDDNMTLGLLYVANAFIVSITLSKLSYRFIESYFLEKRKLFY